MRYQTSHSTFPTSMETIRSGGITVDLMQVLPKIKDGGLIGGDDFVNKPWQHGAAYEPTLVCPFAVYFAEAMRLPFVALSHKQFLIQRAADAGFSFADLAGTYSDLSLKRLSLHDH